MIHRLLLILACSLLLACESKQTERSAAPAPLVSGIDLEGMDVSVRPGDDFFSFTNGGWYAATEIPADKASVDSFSILHDRSQENQRAIIEAAAAADNPAGSDRQKVGDLFASYMDTEGRNARGLAPLLEDWKRIDAIANLDALAVYFAWANQRGFTTPFVLTQYADFKDPTSYMMYTWQSGLGLPDREYYLKDDEKSVELRAKYRDHVEKMMALAGYPEPAAAADMILALETRMAGQHMPKEETRDRVKLYNMYPLDQLPEVMPEFNWDGYLAEAGIDNIDGLMIAMVDYMGALDGIILETSLEDWRTYLKWAVLDSTAKRLTSELDEANFAFYGKTLLGKEQQLPQWRRGVSVVNGSLGEVVGKVYVEEHFPPAAKARMEELVDNLLAAYEVSIRELDWMTDATRAQALDKLSKFTPKIGYPDEWRDYGGLEIRVDDLYGNLVRVAQFNYQRDLARQSGPVDRKEWQMTPQTVNAYYNPPLNEIVFPAAILQPPFFNMEADDAINYGAIGAVIGHEIGHGFDDSGSAFDGDGVLRNWWTDEDRAEFEKRTAKLVEQFNGFQPFDDLHVNGEFTQGENIGDLGGISIGLRAYLMSLDGEEAPVIDGYTGVQRVFIGWGQAWRDKTREQTLRQQIATDPHAPAEYRANGSVRNVSEFYEAFDVAETDALYLPPEERVKIW